MSYKLSDGVLESQLPGWLKKAGQKYGKFRDGRVNYTHADIAPVVMIVVICSNEILLAKRTYGLADAEGYWSTVNGFIDENKPVATIAAQELKEEIGLQINQQKIEVGPSYTITNLQNKRRYIVFPCLVKLGTKPEIFLDHEHSEFTWTKRSELEKFHMLEDTLFTIDAALALI